MAELIVNTGALLQNYRRYAEAGQVIPILKGNGYGLGAQPLRDLLARQGVTLFACATPEEALALAATEKLGLLFGGVDLLEDGTVCEVNSNAHLVNLKKCTGIDTAPLLFQAIQEALQ